MLGLVFAVGGNQPI